MIALLIFLLRLLVLPSKPKRGLEAENAALRRQLAILQRKVRSRVRLTNSDRLFFVLLYRWFPSILKTMTIIQPETLVRWHRAGFGRYWRWKSGNLGGRPPISGELRALIRRMSLENALWGAPHIHGELLKLGFVVAQSTVAKLSWPRFFWTPDSPLEPRRNGPHERQCSWIVCCCFCWSCGKRGRAQPVHTFHRTRRATWRLGAGPALERWAQAGSGASSSAR